MVISTIRNHDSGEGPEMKVKTIGIDLAKACSACTAPTGMESHWYTGGLRAGNYSRLAGEAGALPGGDGSVRLGASLGA